MNNLKEKTYNVIFESDSSAGKTFDLVLLVIILVSVFVVILESVPHLQKDYWNLFRTIEWAVTIIFTIEYLLRIWAAVRPVI